MALRYGTLEPAFEYKLGHTAGDATIIRRFFDGSTYSYLFDNGDKLEESEVEDYNGWDEFFEEYSFREGTDVKERMSLEDARELAERDNIEILIEHFSSVGDIGTSEAYYLGETFEEIAKERGDVDLPDYLEPYFDWEAYGESIVDGCEDYIYYEGSYYEIC